MKIPQFQSKEEEIDYKRQQALKSFEKKKELIKEGKEIKK